MFLNPIDHKADSIRHFNSVNKMNCSLGQKSELATKGDLRDAIKTQTINVGAMLAGSVGVILAAIKWL